MIHRKPNHSVCFLMVCVCAYIYMNTMLQLSAALSKMRLLLRMHFQQNYPHQQISVEKGILT